MSVYNKINSKQFYLVLYHYEYASRQNDTEGPYEDNTKRDQDNKISNTCFDFVRILKIYHDIIIYACSKCFSDLSKGGQYILWYPFRRGRLRATHCCLFFIRSTIDVDICTSLGLTQNRLPLNLPAPGDES